MLKPVVARMTPGQRAVAARMIDQAGGSDPQRVLSRLRVRFGRECAPIRDPLAWLAGRGLPRRGCADPSCEDGVLWYEPDNAGSYEPLRRDGKVVCRRCASAEEDRRADADLLYGAQRRDHPERVAFAPQSCPAARPAPPRPLMSCNDCERASRSLRPDGLCSGCHANRLGAQEWFPPADRSLVEELVGRL